jgi:tRNA pseudouridine38-40 synthase
MPRYFLEISYKGGRYSGFQVQENANSVQEEVEKALAVYYRSVIQLTGSSRTDTAVNALQNFFHADITEEVPAKMIYNINAILPDDIVLKNIYRVANDAHCRFDALSREYHYHVYRQKDPFVKDIAYYFPYSMDFERLQAAAAVVGRYEDFTSFSKRNTQAKTPYCQVAESCWMKERDEMVYKVRANRFLRGMVRGLVGTMLQVGRGRISVEEFESVIAGRDASKADFSVPGHGLFLARVNYPEGFLGEAVG